MNALQTLPAASARHPLYLAFRVLLTLIIFTSTFGPVASFAQTETKLPGAESIKDIDRIHQGDQIEIDVVGSFDFDWRGGLNPEGFIDSNEKLPDPIFARCKTPTELAGLVTASYKKALRDPVVEVRILNRNGRALAYIDGAVKTPMRLQIKRDVHLKEIVVLAGGFTDVIGNEISIFRPEGASCESGDSGPKEAKATMIKITDLLAGTAGSNPKIVPGDIVTVVESLPIYVIGGVGNPQRIAAREGVTLSRAIDAAGGLNKSGNAGSITIYRRAAGGTRVINVDLEKVRSGDVDDPRLEANDVIDVPLKGEPKRRFPPVVYGRETAEKQMPLRIIE